MDRATRRLGTCRSEAVEKVVRSVGSRLTAAGSLVARKANTANTIVRKAVIFPVK